MSRFDSSLYYKSLPGGAFDIWDATPRDMRFNVPSSTTLVVDSSLEANLPYIAHVYLGDQSLWWTILYFNGLMDPISDIYALAVIRIPDRPALISYLERVLPGKTRREYERDTIQVEQNPPTTPVPYFMRPPSVPPYFDPEAPEAP